MPQPPLDLPYLLPGQAFPPVAQAWTAAEGAEGLLAVGADLSVPTLLAAYGQGIFPWGAEQGVTLWFSPNPRMVLQVADFRLRRSLKQRIKQICADASYSLRIDSDFEQTMRRCAQTPRPGQAGSWIDGDMVQAYMTLHAAGHAHSVELWQGQRMVGGLYCTALGRAVFGESMFALQRDASKVALAALVLLCRQQGAAFIDCQQNTPHLASLGAAEMPRSRFVALLDGAKVQPPMRWQLGKEDLPQLWGFEE